MRMITTMTDYILNSDNNEELSSVAITILGDENPKVIEFISELMAKNK